MGRRRPDGAAVKEFPSERIGKSSWEENAFNEGIESPSTTEALTNVDKKILCMVGRLQIAGQVRKERTTIPFSSQNVFRKVRLCELFVPPLRGLCYSSHAPLPVSGTILTIL
jgi:hypothetical protein